MYRWWWWLRANIGSIPTVRHQFSWSWGVVSWTCVWLGFDNYFPLSDTDRLLRAFCRGPCFRQMINLFSEAELKNLVKTTTQPSQTNNKSTKVGFYMIIVLHHHQCPSTFLSVNFFIFFWPSKFYVHQLFCPSTFFSVKFFESGMAFFFQTCLSDLPL